MRRPFLNFDDDYKSHFIEKLHIKETKEFNYFYLDIVKKSEHFLRSLVDDLTKRADHSQKKIDIEKHVKQSLTVLENIVKTKEQKDQFTIERQQLYQNIFSKSFFLLTGKPGAGKTYETSKIIEHLTTQKRKSFCKLYDVSFLRSVKCILMHFL
jgi:exodeoxyribonuclease V alpha subunit